MQNKHDVQKLCQKIKTESLHHLSDYKKSTEQLLAVQNKYQSLVKTHAALGKTHDAHLLEHTAVKKENAVLSDQNSRVHTELSTLQGRFAEVEKMNSNLRSEHDQALETGRSKYLTAYSLHIH